MTDIKQFDSLLAEARTGWSRAAADQNVRQALCSAADPLPALRLDCGRDDFLLEPNRLLHRQLQQASIAHVYEEFPGGHDWAYWALHLEDTLRFFAAALAREPGSARASS
jgi:enterochelin esterase-like enzyme